MLRQHGAEEALGVVRELRAVHWEANQCNSENHFHEEPLIKLIGRAFAYSQAIQVT